MRPQVPWGPYVTSDAERFKLAFYGGYRHILAAHIGMTYQPTRIVGLGDAELRSVITESGGRVEPQTLFTGWDNRRAATNMSTHPFALLHLFAAGWVYMDDIDNVVQQTVRYPTHVTRTIATPCPLLDAIGTRHVTIDVATTHDLTVR